MRKPGWRSQESEISRFQPAPPPLSSCPSTRDAEAHLPGVETEAPPPPPQGRPVRARGGRGAPGGGARLWNLSPGRRDAATAGGHGAAAGFQEAPRSRGHQRRALREAEQYGQAAWWSPAKVPVQGLGRWPSPLGMRVAHPVGRPSPSLRWPTCLKGRMAPPLPRWLILVALPAQAMGDQTCA